MKIFDNTQEVGGIQSTTLVVRLSPNNYSVNLLNSAASPITLATDGSVCIQVQLGGFGVVPQWIQGTTLGLAEFESCARLDIYGRSLLNNPALVISISHLGSSLR